MATSSKILDLDAKYGEDQAPPIETAKFRYLGQDWTLLCSFNLVGYGRIQASEEDQVAGAIVDFIVNLVVPEERNRFGKALVAARVDGDKLNKLIKDLTELAGKGPTTSPASSPVTRVTRASKRKSTAS